MAKIAASINTLRAFCQTEQGLLDTLTRLKDMGFEGVELEFGLLKNGDRDTVARHMADLGLEAASIRSPFSRTEFGLEDMIDQAKAFGCVNVGIGTMTLNYFTFGPGAMEQYFEKVEKVIDRFRREGLRPVYSLRDHEFLRQEDGGWIFDELADRDGARGLCFETNLLSLTRAAVDPPRIFERLVGRMPVCRLTDQKLRENEMYYFCPEREECPLGEGLFDIELWAAEAEKAGAEWFVVGQDLCDRDPFECLRISREKALSI